MEFQSVKINIPENCNVIIGQSHFIKTAEDLYEAMVNSVPGRSSESRSPRLPGLA